MEQQYMSVKQAAAYLGYAPKTVSNMVSDNRIPYSRINGKGWARFKKDELDEWMSKGKVETAEKVLEEFQS